MTKTAPLKLEFPPEFGDKMQHFAHLRSRWLRDAGSMLGAGFEAPLALRIGGDVELRESIFIGRSYVLQFGPVEGASTDLRANIVSMGGARLATVRFGARVPFHEGCYQTLTEKERIEGPWRSASLLAQVRAVLAARRVRRREDSCR